MKHKLYLLLVAAVILAVGLVGCKKGDTGPKTYAVTGTVTYNGKPVEGAIVTFVSKDGKTFATGKTDAQGKYTLNTMGKPGAPAGEYLVKITKTEAAPTGGAETEEYVPPEAGGEAAPAEPKHLLPAKYANEQTSGLTATVTTDPSSNVFDFNLTD